MDRQQRGTTKKNCGIEFDGIEANEFGVRMCGKHALDAMMKFCRAAAHSYTLAHAKWHVCIEPNRGECAE